MPVDTRINVPFIPQEGVTSQILTAIQLANEQHNQQQQRNIQQQQATQQGQLGEAQIEEAKARAGFYGTEAQKNQQQIDMVKRAQSMFSAPQGAQPQAAGPDVAQQVQMYPGSDLAKEATANPEAFRQAPIQATNAKWMPQGTPPQLTPFVNAMLPADLSDQEKTVIEAGAQAGRMKAMQTGDIAGYLNDIRSSVDSVVTNRNRNPENQPLTDSDRSNFTKNILPSFENLSPAQQKGALGELASVKDQKALQQLQGRLMQQDNQALQRVIAEKNILANKEVGHNQALDLSGRNKIVADTGKWGDTFTQAQMGLRSLDKAQNGDDLATRMVPTMEVLGINMMGGIRRISPTEYEAARIPVSLANRFNQWVDSHAQGETDPKMVAEGKQLMHDIMDVKYGSYLSEVKSTADTFGKMDYRSVFVMNRDGESVPLSDALKTAPKAAKQVAGGPNLIVVTPEDMK